VIWELVSSWSGHLRIQKHHDEAAEPVLEGGVLAEFCQERDQVVIHDYGGVKAKATLGELVEVQANDGQLEFVEEEEGGQMADDAEELGDRDEGEVGVDLLEEEDVEVGGVFGVAELPDLLSKALK
jgi:hypothetical protein